MRNHRVFGLGSILAQIGFKVRDDLLQFTERMARQYADRNGWTCAAAFSSRQGRTASGWGTGPVAAKRPGIRLMMEMPRHA
jgi:hypothetical protein